LDEENKKKDMNLSGLDNSLSLLKAENEVLKKKIADYEHK